MLIVKPYGRSETAFDGAGTLRRKLRRHVDGRPADDLTDMASFAESHPELVVAQWISAIDKIAVKPKVGGKPSPGQRRLRETLGRAAFDLLGREGLLDLSERREELERLWWSKIHPYGEGDDRKARGREKGRWYARFAGDWKPDAIGDAAAAAIARKIRDYLHGAEYRIGGARPHKQQGRIAARAGSVATGVAALPADFPDGERLWSKADEEEYRASCDVAGAILRKAEEKAREKRRFALRDAAPILFAHYSRLFRDGSGKALPVAEARAAHPGLFALHGAVKDAYARMLKKHRKKSVARILPADMTKLFRLVEGKSDNRDLAALLRLGKEIHYAATSPVGADAPGNAVDGWPADIARSRYRTSEGQSEIKRNEAFVRVWRNTVALAARTAKDWADPNGRIEPDILDGGPIKRAVGDGFDACAYHAKLPLLFGDRSGPFAGEDDAFRRSVLCLALKGWAGLRHGSFHFKGRGGFARALRSGAEGAAGPALAAARDLLTRDDREHAARLVETLRAAHVEHYFDQAKIAALVDAVRAGGPPQAPLPRFRRVLDRAEKAWRRKPFLSRLPPPDNRAALEKPGRLCRYVSVKLLYERAFPAWLEGRDHAALNAWIRRAAERATEAARKINKDEHAVARAAGLIRLREGEGIAVFTDRLTAATATELRVQRGYGGDAEQARKQAKYIDDLCCDVVGQAFEAWLKEAYLVWMLEDLGDGPLPENKPGDLEAVPPPATASSGEEAEDWEAVLYFLLHLVPVDAVNRLQHQLRKWSVLEGGPSAEAEAIGRLFDLYVAMHDAKFEGGEGVAGAKALKSLFESKDAFSRVCPEQPGEDTGRYVPWRGLREILRFGDSRPLMPVFEKHSITAREVDELAAFEKGEDGDSLIALRQAKREQLHEKWTKKKKTFSDEDKGAYRAALADVVRHRRLAAHVRLADHARLHRLLMAVLGRLVDYAGLWERDLHFATLVLVWLRGKKPKQVFDDKGLGFLRDGRIVDALRRLSRDEDGKAVSRRLKRLFGDNFLDGKTGSSVAIRNDLTHFKMLQGKAARLDLTKLVDDTRRLMAYDRKLKNAVSKSVIELMAREGLVLAWKMEAHRLAGATVKARQAVHLEDRTIKEDLHGREFVAMVADLFAGEARLSGDDVVAARRAGGEEAGARKHGKPGKRRQRRRGSRRRNGRFSA